MAVQFFFALGIVISTCTRILTLTQAFANNGIDIIKFENCPSKSSCKGMGNTTYFERVCECDSWCELFGDCCADAGRFSSVQMSSYTCMLYGTKNIHQGVYMINSCPVNYEDDEVKRQCRNDNFSDPLLSIPVTDISTRKSYLNRYCALCHNASPSSLKTWMTYFCEATDSNLNISWDNVTYSESHNKWGYLLNGYFYPCEFVFDKPPSVDAMLRLCRYGLVSKCPRTWTHRNYIEACDSYMEAVRDSTGTTYQNPHCAVCNGVPVDDLACLHSEVDSLQRNENEVEKKERNKRIMVPLSFTRSLVKPIRRPFVEPKCGKGKVYDPFAGRCHRFVCPFPGYVPQGKRCVKQ
ncbi:SMB domain-containing protein [Trichonephila clavipes]|nr:SMB domain-containing protein [Trichonephila clavipes]